MGKFTWAVKDYTLDTAMENLSQYWYRCVLSCMLEGWVNYAKEAYKCMYYRNISI